MHRTLALVAAAALAVAACGGDDEPVAEEAPAETTASGDVQVGPTGPAPTDPAEVGRAWPLTGEPLDDTDRAQRPALVAKIDNAEAARPQAGLNEADLVVEEIIEGGTTRLLAVFHSDGADPLGPIRSARSTDVPVLASLEEPLFAWSGANTEFAQLISEQDIVDVGVDVALAAYERDDSRTGPSDLMTSTEALYAAAPEDAGEAPRALFRYREDPSEVPLLARAVTGLDVDFGATEVGFTWVPGEGRWEREQNGTPHLDADGDQVAPENVVVQFVTYRDTGLVDATGAPVPEAELMGEGQAFIFVDGRLIQGGWSRTTRDGPTEFRLADGSPVELAPGATWVLLAELGQARQRDDLAAQQGAVPSDGEG